MDPLSIRYGNHVTSSLDMEEFIYVDEYDFRRLIKPNNTYQPIPISEKSLKAFGLDMQVLEGVVSFDDDYEDEDADTYYWHILLPDNRKMTPNTSSLTLVKFGDGPYYLSLASGKLRVEVEFIHELENLLYSLTGYECLLLSK